MRFAAITHALPSNKITNADAIESVERASSQHLSAAEIATLTQMLSKCFESTGTTCRYHLAKDESAYEIATRAGRRALSEAQMDPSDIDLLLYVGIGKGALEPATANIFQDALGLRRATCFDLVDACASWVRALQLAHAYIKLGMYKNIMILNAEFLGRQAHRYEVKSLDEFPHWHPSLTIGEASTATIVTASSDERADEPKFSFRTWGDKRDLCFVPTLEFQSYFGKTVDPSLAEQHMRFVSYGTQLMDFGSRRLIEHYKSAPEFNGATHDVVFGHAASNGMSKYVLKKCSIDDAKFVYSHHLFANTVSASVPLAMCHALSTGQLRDSDRVLIMVASAGISTALLHLRFHH